MTTQDHQTPSGHATAARSRDVWLRSNWVWSLIFIASIVLSLVFFLEKPDQAPSLRWRAGLICLVMVLWHLGGLRLMRRIGDFQLNLPYGLAYILFLVAAWFSLVRIHPDFYLAQAGLWSQVFIVLPIVWAAGFGLLLFGLNFYQQTIGSGSVPDWPETIVFLGLTLAGIFFGVWIHNIIVQSAERKLLIRRLEEAQADLARSERAAGVAAERQRLAHEIHDTLAQGFTSILMNLEAAEQSFPIISEESQRYLDRVRKIARDSLGEARRVVDDLRPEVLEGAPLDEALERVVRRWAAQGDIPAAFTHTGERLDLHPEVEVTLLRAMQEALANVRKHARARDVQVTLSYLPEVILLDVKDDGVGMDHEREMVDPDTSGGFGLVAMKARVRQLGGELTVESEPGEGTTLAISIPLAETAVRDVIQAAAQLDEE